MAADSKDNTLLFAGLALAAVLIVGFLFYGKSIAPVKIAPLNLVAAGSQAAVNPSTIPTNTGLVTTQGMSNAQAQAAQNAALYGGIGNVLSTAISTFGGGYDDEENDDEG